MTSASWETLEHAIKQYSEKDRAFIEQAYRTAETCHTGQIRKSGDPYITHPLAVAVNVAGAGLDAKAVAATLLHDTIEDCEFDPKILKKEFGEEVLFLVESITKLSKVRYTRLQRKVEVLRKMFLALAEDIRVVIIKLYDRLHNMETIGALEEDDRRRIAIDTLELYAPLADRLGMGELKGELEDLAFPYAHPDECAWVLKETKERIHERAAYLKGLLPVVVRELTKERVTIIDAHLRAKHYYSLWKKLLKCDMDFNAVYDLAAIRIIVPNIESCYQSLGVIHKLFTPLPGRIKDYIALPKTNGYRSLHTAVITDNQHIVEIQIRTPEMHEEAEHGVAAHWSYEEAGKPSRGERGDKRADTHQARVIKHLSEWQSAFASSSDEEYLEALKIDFFKNRIFVLTPKGEVIDLPEGATPIDFAYQVHSDIGNHMVGAKVNHKMVGFGHALHSGDTVEILTQKKQRPSPDWLAHAKTSEARTKIRAMLKRSGFTLPKILHAKRRELEYVFLVRGENRVGLLKDISSVFAERSIDIVENQTDRTVKDHHQLIFRVKLKKEHLAGAVATAIRQIPDVVEVRAEKIIS